MKSPHTQFKARSYDRLSRIYQLLETIVFGPYLQKTRLAHIDVLQDAQRVLILGEGDGRFLKRLLEINPNCQVDCLDKSSAMLTTTQNRLKKNNIATANINFIQTDALHYSYPANSYDAIITLFFLDNFNAPQLEALIPKLVASLKLDAMWLVAGFQQPEKGFIKCLASGLLWIMYRFFRWQTDISAKALTNPKTYLATNLRVETTKNFLGTLLYSEVWSFPSDASISPQDQTSSPLYNKKHPKENSLG